MNSGDRHRRFTQKEKSAAVLRLLREEPIDKVADELGVSASRLARWKTVYTSAGLEALANENAGGARFRKFEKYAGKALPWIGFLLALALIIALLQRMMMSPRE